MDSLIVIAGVVWVVCFLLIVRFSRDRYKYTYNGASGKTALRAWKTLGGRTAYYRLAIAFSGLVTMAVVAVVRIYFY